jgi:hypothetical protein
VLWIIIIFLLTVTLSFAADKDLEIRGQQLISMKPPFSLRLPLPLYLVYSFSQNHPEEGSLTRGYFFVQPQGKQVEDMLILQISDKTNPQAAPMTLPLIKPYTEKRSYVKEKIKKGELTGEVLIQLMAWNPDAPSLQPLMKKGISIPSYWALQGQFTFLYLGDHAVSIRYSKDVRSFGMKVSEEGKAWDKDAISSNEKKAVDAFKQVFTEMVHSFEVQSQ